jgi:hypothetical protein
VTRLLGLGQHRRNDKGAIGVINCAIAFLKKKEFVHALPHTLRINPGRSCYIVDVIGSSRADLPAEGRRRDKLRHRGDRLDDEMDDPGDCRSMARLKADRAQCLQ